jgi:F-type H+-transporting ATPase subunit b
MNINLTLIGQSIMFFMFVAFCMKVVWPPIMKALADRRVKIAEGLAAGERAVREQELAKERAMQTLRDAKMQATEVVTLAQKRAAEIIEEAKEDARSEGDRLIGAARTEIELESNRAREDLRRRIGELALAGAEKILQREVNAATHRDIVESLVKQI